MSEQPDEDQSTPQTEDQPSEPGEVTDSQLPEDLQPGEDNPLATHPDQTGNPDDQIGADREEDPETAPLTADEAEYGSGGGSSSSGTDGGSGSGGDGTGDGRVGSEEDDGSDTLDNGGGGAG